MGAWAYGSFGNDDAGDWVIDLSEKPNFSFLQRPYKIPSMILRTQVIIVARLRLQRLFVFWMEKYPLIMKK
jgi:hypothetical protein